MWSSRPTRCGATARRRGRDRDRGQALAGSLDAAPITVGARAGEGGRLFGSVTSADIVAAVLGPAGVEVDRRSVTLDEPIKELGEVEVPVRLHPDVVAARRRRRRADRRVRGPGWASPGG